MLLLRPAERVRVKMRVRDRWRMAKWWACLLFGMGFLTPEGPATTGAPTVYGLCCMHGIGGLATTPPPPSLSPPQLPPLPASSPNWR